jgi:tetratricopeptide (TPR) repeat protein
MHTMMIPLLWMLAPAMAVEPELPESADQAVVEETLDEPPEADAPEPEAEAPEPEALDEAAAETLDEAAAETLDEAAAETELRYREALQTLKQAEEAGAGLEGAAAALERVIERLEGGQAPGFEHADQAWYLLGWSLRELQPTRALEAWQHVVQRYPDSSLAGASLIHLGEAAMAEKDWELAAGWLERARTGPYEPATQRQAGFLVGWVHYHCSAWDEAVEALAGVLTPVEDNDLRDEALEYLALVWLARSEAEGGDVVRLLEATLPRVPAALHSAFAQRCAELLEQSARFEEAQALRGRGEPPRTRRPWRTKHAD